MTSLYTIACAGLTFWLGCFLGFLVASLMSASASADLCHNCRLTHAANFDYDGAPAQVPSAEKGDQPCCPSS